MKTDQIYYKLTQIIRTLSLSLSLPHPALVNCHTEYRLRRKATSFLPLLPVCQPATPARTAPGKSSTPPWMGRAGSSPCDLRRRSAPRKQHAGGRSTQLFLRSPSRSTQEGPVGGKDCGEGTVNASLQPSPFSTERLLTIISLF